MARREPMKKRRIYGICEHFEEAHNTVSGSIFILRWLVIHEHGDTEIYFQVFMIYRK